jgi:hypothetical protein
MKPGQIFVHKRNKHVHWHVLLVSGETAHLYHPASETHKTINTRTSHQYKRWYPPTGVKHVKA